MNPNYINKVSYKLPQIWFPNLNSAGGSRTQYALTEQVSSQRSIFHETIKPATLSHSPRLKMEEVTSETSRKKKLPWFKTGKT